MIELLILYVLTKHMATMYGIQKSINTNLSAMTKQSIGTIKPALVRLERSGFIRSEKTLSKGGRPSVFYVITEEGRVALKGYILGPVRENPIHFLSVARARLYCSDILTLEENYKLLKLLKSRAEILMAETSKLLEDKAEEFYPRMVLDNLYCEYRNFISLLEGIERACNR